VSKSVGRVQWRGNYFWKEGGGEGKIESAKIGNAK